MKCLQLSLLFFFFFLPVGRMAIMAVVGKVIPSGVLMLVTLYHGCFCADLVLP